MAKPPEFGRTDRPYLKLLTAGLNLRDAGKEREAADILLRAYRGKGKTWACRNLLLCAYTDLLTGDPNKPPAVTPTNADMQALRDIVKNPSLTLVERTHAHYVLGLSLWDAGLADESAKENKKLIKIAERATQKERAAPVLTAYSGNMCWVPSSQMIDKDVARAKHNLLALDPNLDVMPPPPQGVTVHGRKTPWPLPAGQAVDLDWFEAATKALNKAIHLRSAACSECARPAAEAKLTCCSNCRLAYYCSRECQRANWAAHKPQCRAPGEHLVGDVVQLQTLQARPELNGQFFRVLERDPNSEGRWRVQNRSLEGTPTLSVRQESMQRVLWHD